MALLAAGLTAGSEEAGEIRCVPAEGVDLCTVGGQDRLGARLTGNAASRTEPGPARPCCARSPAAQGCQVDGRSICIAGRWLPAMA